MALAAGLTRQDTITVKKLIAGKNGNAEFAGVDNAEVDISARCGKGGHCGSGQCRSGQIGNTGSNNRLF